MCSGAMVRVSSPRAKRASVSASGLEARRALMAGCSGRPSNTAALLSRSLAGVAILEVPPILTPVEDALAHDVIEADGDKVQVNDHLPKAKEALTCDLRKFAVDDGPGHHEAHLDVEQDEQDGDQVE